MRSNMLKMSALVLGAVVALSANFAYAIPASPFPTGKTKLAAIPASPFPTGKTKLAAIPASPFPTGKTA